MLHDTTSAMRRAPRGSQPYEYGLIVISATYFVSWSGNDTISAGSVANQTSTAVFMGTRLDTDVEVLQRVSPMIDESTGRW